MRGGAPGASAPEEGAEQRFHDRADHVIPVGESRRLWAAMSGRPGARYTEMGLRHLRIPSGWSPLRANPRWPTPTKIAPATWSALRIIAALLPSLRASARR